MDVCYHKNTFIVRRQSSYEASDQSLFEIFEVSTWKLQVFLFRNPLSLQVPTPTLKTPWSQRESVLYDSLWTLSKFQQICIVVFKFDQPTCSVCYLALFQRSSCNCQSSQSTRNYGHTCQYNPMVVGHVSPHVRLRVACHPVTDFHRRGTAENTILDRFLHRL